MAKEFKPPAKSSTLERQAKAADVQLGPVIKVGTLVLFRNRVAADEAQRSEAMELVGWVVQNSLSPGGQTSSYLVAFHSPSPANADLGQRGQFDYPPVKRISHADILEIIDELLP